MYYYPTLQQLKEMPDLNRYGVVPVCCELYADRKTPIEVLRILKHVSSHCYMLESAEDKKQWGRYTFLGYEPTLEITCHDHKLSIRSGMTITETVTHPGKYLRQILEQYKSPKLEGMPPFTGGLVGYFSYDYIKYSEPSLTLDAKEDEHFKDMDLMLFDKLICFDNYRQKIQLFSKDAYCEMVQKGKNYIKEGDIFQVVLSNRMEADMEGSLLDTYRVLRTSNPSPYMFYFSSEDVEIAGASPETLVKLENDKLYTFPLAGTRKRGETEAEDQRLEQELLADEKERAEHNMLVDLGRNDIGKISRIASVEVVKYMEIERFSHVMHIGSTVTGTIREDKDAVDAVDAILPAGTLSGAPKLRACEIINELEDNKRGIYGGAIGYLDFTGNLDTCIAIRLAFAKNGKVYVRSGAGIVADSVPEKEYEECINKAKAVMNALKEADGGI